MFLHSSTQSDLLSDLCADGVGQDDLGQIGLDGADAAAGRQRADVHHQHLVLGQLLDLRGHGQTRSVVSSLLVPRQTTANTTCLCLLLELHKKVQGVTGAFGPLTLAAFLSPSVRTPSSLLSRK